MVLDTQWYNYLSLTLVMAGKKREFSDLPSCDPCDDANKNGIVLPLVHSHLDLVVSVLYLLISLFASFFFISVVGVEGVL